MKSSIVFWILIASGMVIMGGYVFFGWMPARHNIEDVQMAVAQADLGIDEAIRNVRQIPDMRLRCREAKSRVGDLQKRILLPDSISPAMKMLDQLARQYQVRVDRITFSTDSLFAGMRSAQSQNKASFELPLWLTFNGHFLDFGMMLEHLDQLPYSIRFTDFNIIREEQSETLVFETLARVRIQLLPTSQKP